MEEYTTPMGSEAVEPPRLPTIQERLAVREEMVRTHYYIDPRYALITDPSHPILRTPAKAIKNTQDPKIIELTKQLVAWHYICGGIGLAAPQIGINLSMAVCQAPDMPAPLVVYNPRIIGARELLLEEDGENIGWDCEGCLSHPGITLEVARVKKITAWFQRFNEPKGKAYNVEGFLARILQHEVDHLNGVLMTDKAFVRNMQTNFDGQTLLKESMLHTEEHGHLEVEA